MIFIMSSTTILSIATKYISDLKKIKSLADRGYRFYNYKLVKNKKILIYDFIPFVNLIKLTDYLKKNKIDFSLNDEEMLNYDIIPMSMSEKKDYNHSFLSALNINRNNEIEPNSVLIFMKDDIENIIYYNKRDDVNIIISTNGPISKLPKDLQYKEFHNQLEELNIKEKVVNNKEEVTIYPNYSITNTKEKAKVYTKKRNFSR